MTYLGFLFRFLVLPILLMLWLAHRDRQRGLRLPSSLALLPPHAALLALAFVAVTYTTPWDNYLVATGVWWYDPERVTGITLGWVPLEEYLFFVLQPLLIGLWFLFLARRIRVDAPFRAYRGLRVSSVAVAATFWLAAVLALLVGWKPGTYLALELAWALPPIALQLAVGADILWHYRRLLFPALFSATLYLAIADALAIGIGTWTIDPGQSLGIVMGGGLPVEELLFFLLTNVLLLFGLTLCLATEVYARLPVKLSQARIEASVADHPG